MKKLSRTRLYQITHKKEGKCIVCSSPRINASFCEYHRKKKSEYRSTRRIFKDWDKTIIKLEKLGLL